MVLCKYDSKQKVILMRWLRDANEFSIEIRLLFSRKVVAGTTKFCRGPTLAPAGSPARWRPTPASPHQSHSPESRPSKKATPCVPSFLHCACLRVQCLRVVEPNLVPAFRLAGRHGVVKVLGVRRVRHRLCAGNVFNIMASP